MYKYNLIKTRTVYIYIIRIQSVLLTKYFQANIKYMYLQNIVKLKYVQ